MYESVEGSEIRWYFNWILKDKQVYVTSQRWKEHIASRRHTPKRQEEGHLW